MTSNPVKFREWPALPMVRRTASVLDQPLTGATGLQARTWCIFQAGFAPDALAFAAEKGILISNAEHLAALARWVK